MNNDINELKLKTEYGFDDLVAIMKLLRSECGCPWDKEQTHESIRKNLIEETYEVVDAIDRKDVEALKEELGDVLLQVVFHSQMESERGRFSVDDVCNDVCRKLIVRHPHILGDTVADDAGTVLKNWEEIKNKTKGMKKQSESLAAVPASLPALMRAQKMQSRAAKVGFDFAGADAAVEKLEEETKELREALNSGSGSAEELGDVLFSAVNVARFISVDAEECLFRATEKFLSRFQTMERLAEAEGRTLAEADMSEMDELWSKAKE